MKITLETVRDTLRETFGRESFIASFIRRIREGDACPTACIDAKGTLQYNPDFLEEHITTPQDLFCLTVHELMHPMFGHFVYGGGPLENIGADAIINAAITNAFPHPSGEGSLFKAFYEPEGLQGLLRPGSAMAHSRYERLYMRLWREHLSQGKLSTGEVITTLRVLTPTPETLAIPLLGRHGAKSGEGPSMDRETRGKIAEELKRAVKEHQTGRIAGFCPSLYDLLTEVLDQNVTLSKVMLTRYATRRKVDRFRQAVQQPRLTVTPIPIRPSKRDLVLLSAGVPVFHYRNQSQQPTWENRGLAVYIDVSGSVNAELPRILSLLRTFKRELLSVFLFSNKVVEIPFKKLMAGHISTTYGTDFNCVAMSIIEQELDKAVIFTDGYAPLQKHFVEQLKAQKFEILTVLFGGRAECPEWAPFGPVVQLEDVCQ